MDVLYFGLNFRSYLFMLTTMDYCNTFFLDEIFLFSEGHFMGNRELM